MHFRLTEALYIWARSHIYLHIFAVSRISQHEKWALHVTPFLPEEGENCQIEGVAVLEVQFKSFTLIYSNIQCNILGWARIAVN